MNNLHEYVSPEVVPHIKRTKAEVYEELIKWARSAKELLNEASDNFDIPVDALFVADALSSALNELAELEELEWQKTISFVKKEEANNGKH